MLLAIVVLATVLAVLVFLVYKFWKQSIDCRSQLQRYSGIADLEAAISAAKVQVEQTKQQAQQAALEDKQRRELLDGQYKQALTKYQEFVLMGLRIVQTLEKFPDPTPEELHFFQLSFAGPPTDLSRARQYFKNWVLAKGFGDIQKCIRATLERLFIFRTVELKIKANEKFDIGACEKELWRRARQPGYPVLVDKINSLFGEPLRYQDELDSFNNARNCLEHENGVVTEKRCTNPEKNKLVIHGTRFKMFFKTAQAEVPAELGKPGPRNSPLMLGAEEFQIEFGIGQLLEISLKQFIDILNTCVFIRADIESRLSKNVAVATT